MVSRDFILKVNKKYTVAMLKGSHVWDQFCPAWAPAKNEEVHGIVTYALQLEFVHVIVCITFTKKTTAYPWVVSGLPSMSSGSTGINMTDFQP